MISFLFTGVQYIIYLFFKKFYLHPSQAMQINYLALKLYEILDIGFIISKKFYLTKKYYLGT